jgi:hypothetical protein
MTNALGLEVPSAYYPRSSNPFGSVQKLGKCAVSTSVQVFHLLRYPLAKASSRISSLAKTLEWRPLNYLLAASWTKYRSGHE